MSRMLPFLIAIATIVLVGMAWVNSGGMARGQMRSSRQPEEGVRFFLSQVQSRDWNKAHSLLANAGEVETPALIHDLGGSNGSLLTYASLENFDVWGLHATEGEATV